MRDNFLQEHVSVVCATFMNSIPLWPGTKRLADKLSSRCYLPRKVCKKHPQGTLYLTKNYSCLRCERHLGQLTSKNCPQKQKRRVENKLEGYRQRIERNKRVRRERTERIAMSRPVVCVLQRISWSLRRVIKHVRAKENRHIHYKSRRHARRHLRRQERYSAHDIRSLAVRQNGRCYWCHGPMTVRHIDHVWPLSKGGSNGPENLVLACAPCNQLKSAKTPMEFAGRLF